MEVTQIKNMLLEGKDKSLQRRRLVGLFSALGLVDFSIISLYQMGIVKHLPDFSRKFFNSDKANASEAAYALGLPDGIINSGLNSLIMALSTYKADIKSGRPLLTDFALTSIVFANAAGALKYVGNMMSGREKACPYYLTGALLNIASVPFALLDFYEKVKKYLSKEKQLQLV